MLGKKDSFPTMIHYFQMTGNSWLFYQCVFVLFVVPLSTLAQPSTTESFSNAVDWMQIDRRAEDGWWHLYPFGERFRDVEISSKIGFHEQIDLDFFFSYYGFRFNYTYIGLEGFLAFSDPWYIQPPYLFPEPRWPESPDVSLIAAFLTDQALFYVEDYRVSNIWTRVVSRPHNLIGQSSTSRGLPIWQDNSQLDFDDSTLKQRYYNGQMLKTQDGRLEDPELLDELTRDIRSSAVGARGFTADYAQIVTWERMSYGGAPKATKLDEYQRVKQWQNTYQLVLVTDESRSYVILNYANINWTSSTSAGSLSGRGGRQSALVGFNGGNQTGFYELPLSATGSVYKLVQFGSGNTAGRWIARVDEEIIYGGCGNQSIGTLRLHRYYGSLPGGFALNVSGPCFRPSDIIKLDVTYGTFDCEREPLGMDFIVVNQVVASCFLPVDSLYILGHAEVKLSTDGGRNYPFWTMFNFVPPNLDDAKLRLLNDPLVLKNNWHSAEAENLTLIWPAENITTNFNTYVDLTLYGYSEKLYDHQLLPIGTIAERIPNTGVYHFNPKTLVREGKGWPAGANDAWGGLIRVSVSDGYVEDRGDRAYWSRPVSFAWYLADSWKQQYGDEWSLSLCQQWADRDVVYRYADVLEGAISCPCTLDQAAGDFGRFTPQPDCDMHGNSLCPYNKGAKHCVMSVITVWAVVGEMSQSCCYDYEGWLMFSQDYEHSSGYPRFFGPGTPQLAHPFGTIPYRRAPFVPSLSNFYNDLLPYDMCCNRATGDGCDLFYKQRQSSGCRNYVPSVLGFAYGLGHFVTFDGVRYSFPGNGYFILTQMKGYFHDLMVQIRMERPPKTIWDENVNATVITGLAAKDNGSDTVQIFARKEFRRWRYRLDVYVDGQRVFFDRFFKKRYFFRGGMLLNPPRNMNTSEVQIAFETGVGIKVQEANGILQITISLPPNYNETAAVRAH